jgi:hypothetical protein
MLATKTIGVTAGTGLTGGGTITLGGSASISVDTAAVPLLAGTNVYSKPNSFTNAVSVAPSGATAASAPFRVVAEETATHGRNASLQISNTAAGGANFYLRAGATGTSTPAGGFSIADDVGYRFVIDAQGRVGIGGTLIPSNSFQIKQGAGNAIADGWSTYSSARWKTNIQPLTGALDKVQRLRGVTYDLKEDGRHEIGVIAEEVGAVLPQIVTFEENGKDARGVDYTRLSAVLIEAVKEQQLEIEALKEQVRILRGVENRLNALEAANATTLAKSRK